MARTITLTHATVDVPDNKAYAGQTVTVTPDDRTAEGYQFVRWEVVSGIADRELIRSTTDNTATFTMPDEDVVLKAVPKTLYTITVERRHCQQRQWSLPALKSGDPVTVVATAGQGRCRLEVYRVGSYQCTGRTVSIDTAQDPDPPVQYA